MTVAVGLCTGEVTLLGTDASLGPFPPDPERPALKDEGCRGANPCGERGTRALLVLIPNMC